ncbi:hypothetical protein CBR_g59364 [Chara braunii]|uniref:Protein MEMO1 n=1 Tax=Chara braunii TaxID=69332 RepID=A0A388MEX7_CHABU|nr:hypothetical protein CBR_g59364 [Chara braunii]|eukprot:GBG93126.1 hypothetical protein CBR_g59364 [Chara braunii]
MWSPRGKGFPRDRVIYRDATHAGSWYTDNPRLLSQELEAWLAATAVLKSDSAQAAIAPHAGYRYSGRCAAYAFAHINPKNISRVFLLGPSHHYFTRRCALSRASAYRTPLGDIPIDEEVYRELWATGQFEEMSRDVDEAEHSMEMHLPYLYKVFEGHHFTLVPILVGALSPEAEERYGTLLSKYMDDPSNFFSISSDFCHWGTRFNYTRHEKKREPIYKAIEALDHRGMDLIEIGDPEAFTEYLQESENTICGRHPIGILLHILKKCRPGLRMKFVQYEQSSHCKTLRDSSVSYAAAVTIPKTNGA